MYPVGCDDMICDLVHFCYIFAREKSTTLGSTWHYVILRCLALCHSKKIALQCFRRCRGSQLWTSMQFPRSWATGSESGWTRIPGKAMEGFQDDTTALTNGNSNDNRPLFIARSWKHRRLQLNCNMFGVMSSTLRFSLLKSKGSWTG